MFRTHGVSLPTADVVRLLLTISCERFRHESASDPFDGLRPIYVQLVMILRNRGGNSIEA